MKILLLYKGYPRISHSYQSVEAIELSKNHEIMIISFDWDLLTKSDNHLPYIFNHPINELENMLKKLNENEKQQLINKPSQGAPTHIYVYPQ